MLTLDKKLRLDRSTCESPNLTDRFSHDDLVRLGNYIWEGYIRDEASRAKWLQRTSAAMDLAMQVSEAKTFPWPNCSNVAFPLVTIAALQFHSRAYPALISGPDVVKCRVPGYDPEGKLRQQGDRVSRYMSYQVLEEDTAWEEQHDRLLLNVPIVGCAFVKTYFDASLGHNISELVLARDLVMNYYAKSVETTSRKTHIVPLYRNDVYERCIAGRYRDITKEAWYDSPQQPYTPISQSSIDKRAGTIPPQVDESTPLTFLEQHCVLDLDGDGYAEPYTVTIEANSKCVVRIVARWERPDDVERVSSGRVLRIRPTEYFTKYGFIPSPDGSIYDMGFGVLLGPLNESVNSLVNQLIDAGTMSVAAGGFLSRGVKIRGGAYTFQPFGWQRVDSTGDDLRKGIFPLPTREPSTVLFQLLSLLVNYTQRISGSTDMMVGENPGQNTPAQTSQTMVEQGMKIYSSLFKRQWRCMKEEFRKQYILNATYLPQSRRFGADGVMIGREDFLGDPTQIVPVADPNVSSDVQRAQQALAVKQAATSTPGYNLPEVEKNFLRALKVDNVDLLYPGPDKVPPLANPKIQVEQIKLQAKQAALEWDKQQFLLNLMAQEEKTRAEITNLEAQAAKALAEAGGADAGHKIAAFDAALGALKAHDESLRGHIDLLLRQQELAHAQVNPPAQSG